MLLLLLGGLWTVHTSAVAARIVVQEGDRIASARGIPGTLGLLAWTEAGAPVLLSSHHVLFGDGAAPGDPVWKLGAGSERSFLRLGGRRYGGRGEVVHEGTEVYVDCALAALEVDAGGAGWRAPGAGPKPVVPDPLAGPGAAKGRRPAAPRAGALPAPGTRVVKRGAATGITRGVLMESNASEWALVDGTRRRARGQLVVWS